MGFAPNVTNGYWVMNRKDRIELTSNVTEDPEFDRVEPWMEPTAKEDVQSQAPLFDWSYAQKEAEAIDAYDLAYGDLFQPQCDLPSPDDPDDPMELVSLVQLSKISDNLWQEEDIKQEENPEGWQEEIRESGAISVALRDVRQSIGKDRQEWKVALEAELQSLRDTGAIVPVTHVPRGASILPMKVVLTLKPQKGLTTKKKKARACVWEFSTEKANRFVLYCQR